MLLKHSATLSFSLLAACASGEQEPFLEPSKTPWDLQSLAEEETRLPCRFNVSNSEIKVVQVMWVRESSNGAEEQIITAHFSEGQTGKTNFASQMSKLLHFFFFIIINTFFYHYHYHQRKKTLWNLFFFLNSVTITISSIQNCF